MGVVFDASAAVGEHTVTEDTSLPKDVVDTYFQNMDETQVKGFLNGYGPSFSFAADSKNGRPFVSFDYYLDPSRSVEDAINDIKELARINTRRPYFLPVHVREWSTVEKVLNITKAL